MLWCRFFKVTPLLLAAGLSCAAALAQTTENSAAAANVSTAQPATQTPAPPQVVYGPAGSQKTQVVPVGGTRKVHGSTVPSSMMPREEPLGDAARRLKKKKYRKYHKQRKTHRAKQPPYLR
jgi:hypothetical protein